MIYDRGIDEKKNWIVTEEYYGEADRRKCESVMCQGHGYMCVRASTEEIMGVPFTLVAGTFNRIPTDACNELANSPDFTAVRMWINGEAVTPDGMVKGTYDRHIDLQTGLLERSYTWKSSTGEKFALRFLRVVSLKKLHLCAMRVEVTSKSRKKAELKIVTGVDGDSIEKSEHLAPVDAYAEDGVATVVAKTTDGMPRFRRCLRISSVAPDPVPPPRAVRSTVSRTPSSDSSSAGAESSVASRAVT